MRAACCEATVLRNEVIAPDIRLLTVVWPDRDHAPHAGQFFTLRAWGADEAPFLSRPISVHRWNPDSSTIEFLYQVVGEGTEKIAQLKMKDTFQLTGPMGNGFDVPDILSKYKKIAVVGGGIGTAPMFQLTRELAAAGVKPDVFFGFRDAPYCMEEYREVKPCQGVHRHRRSGLPRLCHPAVRPRRLRCGAGVRPHGHDEERCPPVCREGHPLLCEHGKEDGLRHWCLPWLHLRDQGRRGQERVQERPGI